MRPIRVLVVDDTAVVRRLVSSALARVDGIEVAGVAANGQLALERIDELDPDVVTLDIEMPVMDGLEALPEIVRRKPGLPVVMFSTLTERGGAATLEALSLGASDYVTKPSNSSSLDESLRRVVEDLAPRVRVLGARYRRRRGLAAAQAGAPAAPARPAAMPTVPPAAMPTVPPAAMPTVPPAAVPTVPAVAPTPRRPRPGPVTAVAIGVSTGGPNALAELVPALPADLPVPVLVVQHMPPVFTRLLAERLDSRSAVRVTEAAGGERPQRGALSLAPGDRHLVVRRGATGPVLALTEDAAENSCRPAVDVLFRSAAEVYGSGLLAVVLTGMGQDGLEGARAVLAAGGRVLAQDEATSVVWGMPGAVVRAGLADAVLPLGDVAGEISRLVTPLRPAGRTAAGVS